MRSASAFAVRAAMSCSATPKAASKAACSTFAPPTSSCSYAWRASSLGKRRLGTEPTLFFCDELLRLYAHEDYQVSAAASWAIENWAAAGFWDELVEGWRRYRQRRTRKSLDIGFFTWHARLEANHARHTTEELASMLRAHDIDQDRFVHDANEMLDAVLVFWRGLDEQRRSLANSETADAKAG
jgi:hypothetical protein